MSRRLTKDESAYGMRRMINSVPVSRRSRSGDGYGEISVHISSTRSSRPCGPRATLARREPYRRAIFW